MGWVIGAGMTGVAWIVFVLVFRPFRRGDHAAGRRLRRDQADEYAEAWLGSMTPELDAGSMILAEERAFGGLPPWAAPEADRYAGYGWVSGSSGSDYGPGEFDEWPSSLPADGWVSVPVTSELVYERDEELGPDGEWHVTGEWHKPTRLADTGDVMDARLAADVAAYQRHQDADVRAFAAVLADDCRAYVRALAVAL